MLMQNFKPAADLGISEAHKEALMKTLVLLETGKLIHTEPPEIETMLWNSVPKFTAHFNMAHWGCLSAPCGTVACIGGTAELIGDVNFGTLKFDNARLFRLFNPQDVPQDEWPLITPAQAARALRSYLTTGDAKWAEAVSHTD